MDEIRIYTPDGRILYIAPMSKKAKIVCQLMGEYYIEIPFHTTQQIPFTLGCYIDYNGWDFFLKKDAFPEPISGVDGYKYILKFYAPQHHMEQCIFKWLEGNNKETTFTLTTTLDEFAKLLIDNMSAFKMPSIKGIRWDYNYSYRNDTREVLFDGISCWEAMRRIAEAFGVECWVNEINTVNTSNDLQINFGKLLHGSDWEEWREGEVITRFPASKRGEDVNYGTRFYIYGSAKNIPDDYYENVTGGTTNHISEKRLHLPDGKEYIDVLNGEIVDTLPNGRIIERVIFLEDVFPRNTSTISAVEEHEEEVIEGRKDYTYAISSVDTGFTGSDDEVLGALGITFTSGALSGSTFDVRWNKPFDNKFVVVSHVEGTSGSEQIVIPNPYLKPSVDDTFVLTGIRLPDVKVKEAEMELLSRGETKAREYGADTNVYDCKTDPVYCQLNNKNYRLGRRVKLLGGAFGENGRTSRIQGFEKALWNEYDATYNVGDNSAYSRVKAIAKSYANDSGRIALAESTRWENKVKSLSIAGTTDLAELKGQVALNSANIVVLNQRVCVAIVGEEDTNPEPTMFMSPRNRGMPESINCDECNVENEVYVVEETTEEDVIMVYEDNNADIEEAVIIEEVVDEVVIINDIHEEHEIVIVGEDTSEQSIFIDDPLEEVIVVNDDEHNDEAIIVNAE